MAAGSAEEAPRKLGCAAGAPQLRLGRTRNGEKTGSGVRQEVESDRKWSQTVEAQGLASVTHFSSKSYIWNVPQPSKTAPLARD